MGTIIIGLAITFFIGHFLQWLFVKTRVPDLLLLIIIGFALGPSGLHIIQKEYLGQVGAILATITLIIILYEGGLNLNAKSLIESSLPSLGLSLLTFLSIVILTTLLLSIFFSFSTALLIGIGIGSTSSAIVFPLIKPLSMKEGTKTILSLESAFTDVLSIISFLAVLDMFVNKNYNASNLFFGFGATPFLSIGFGICSALMWSMFRKFFIKLFNMPFSGEAWTLLTYGSIELFNLNGPIGILSFGFTLGNLGLIPKTFSFLFNLTPVTEKELSLLSAISFLFRTLFFLYLGVIMKASSLSIFAWAFALTLLIFFTRYLSVRTILTPKKVNYFDALISFGMGPRGLACAVLATLPLQRGLADGEIIQNIIFYVILLSIVMTSLFVIFGETAKFQKLFSFFFKNYSQDLEPKAETPVNDQNPSY